MEMQCHAHTNVHVRGGLKVEHEPGKRSCICGGGLNTQDIRCVFNVSFKQHEPTGPWSGFDARIHPSRKTHWECIAVEYLLARSNRGDQLIAHHNDMPEVHPEEPEDDFEDEIDTTVCHAADLRADDSDPQVAVVEAQVTSQAGDTGPKSPDEEVAVEEENVLAHQARVNSVIPEMSLAGR